MNESRKLSGKVAIVTGAAQGLGAYFARALAEAGAAVAVVDIVDPGSVAEAITVAGGRAVALCADVTDEISVRSMVQKTIDELGGVHLLVNNAAVFGELSQLPFERIKSGDWDRVMAVNVRGTFECVRGVTEHMRSQRYGKIVNVASASALKGLPMLLHYVTSKGAILAMTRSLARELGKDGIRVNSLAPGLVLSESVIKNSTWEESSMNSIISSRAIQKSQLPTDLLGSLLFLCAEESDFITGQTLVVDGGSVMH